MNAIFYKVSNNIRATSPLMRENCLVCFCLCHVSYGIWISWPGIDPRWQRWKCQVLTIGLPGNFPKLLFMTINFAFAEPIFPSALLSPAFMPRGWGVLEGGFRCPPAAEGDSGGARVPEPSFFACGVTLHLFSRSWLLSKDFWHAHVQVRRQWEYWLKCV